MNYAQQATSLLLRPLKYRSFRGNSGAHEKIALVRRCCFELVARAKIFFFCTSDSIVSQDCEGTIKKSLSFATFIP